MKCSTLLIGILGLSAALSAQAPPTVAKQPTTSRSAALKSSAMTNQDVVDLVKAGFGDDLIIGRIYAAKDPRFDVSTKGLVALKSAGISERVINVMLGEPDRKPPEVPSVPKSAGQVVPTASGEARMGNAVRKSADEDHRIQDAMLVLREMSSSLDKGIPTAIVRRAKAIIVFPHTIQGGFIVGAHRGRGIFSARKTDTLEWSSPAFFTLTGGSFGAQIGGQSLDLVLLVMNQRGLDAVLKNEIKLGGDIGATAGPLGRSAEASTDATFKSEILSYSRSRGLFAGITLKGSPLHQDLDAMMRFYGRTLEAKDTLVDNSIEGGDSALEWQRLLATNAPTTLAPALTSPNANSGEPRSAGTTQVASTVPVADDPLKPPSVAGSSSKRATTPHAVEAQSPPATSAGVVEQGAATNTRQGRNQIQKQLESMYEMSKVALFDPTKVNKVGGIYAIAVDGIQGEVSIQSGNVPTYIVDGKIHTSSDSGAGTLLGSVLTGTKREEARALKKGERVYVTGFDALGNGLYVDVMTVDTFPIIDQGRTRQVSYKARLGFTGGLKGGTAVGFPTVPDAAAMKKLIDRFIVSEAEASAPKRIELGQGTEQVEATFGKPVNIIKLGPKTIYTYKDLKVTFTNGKVTDVQ